MKDLGLLIAHRIGLERNRWLHGRERNKLEEMVGNHIAQSPGGFIEAAALLYPHGFRGRDLDVFNKMPVPDGFKDAVAETEHHQVLYGLFAEIVINAGDLPLFQHLLDFSMQRARSLQIVTEWFFSNHAPPWAVFLLAHPPSSALRYD